MSDPNEEAKRHAVLALIADIYVAGIDRIPPRLPQFRQWAAELDQIYAFYAEHTAKVEP